LVYLELGLIFISRIRTQIKIISFQKLDPKIEPNQKNLRTEIGTGTIWNLFILIGTRSS
jgi:hypothetical protein